MGTDSESLLLTALAESDAEILHRWRSDPIVRHGALMYPVPSTVEAERAWIRSFTPSGTPNDICLAIRGDFAASLIGYCQFRGIDWVSRTAEFGLVIGDPSKRGQGVGKAVLAKAIHFARNELNIRRLWLRVVAYNEAAISLYKRAGFVEEGRMIRHIFRGAAYHDVIVLALEIDPLP